ncbi:hypothetical protein [Luteimicrobium album]|nr:hypothetical protein [Luteimicrobium album]
MSAGHAGSLGAVGALAAVVAGAVTWAAARVGRRAADVAPVRA